MEIRKALVVGNSQYLQFEPLRNPANDARAMAAVLKRLGFKTMAGIDLDRDAMEDILDGFGREIEGADVALFYYAGHGIQVNGQNYIVPVDAALQQQNHLKRRTFALDEVLSVMTSSASSSIAFLDACRDNPFSSTRSRILSSGTRGVAVVSSGLAQVSISQGAFVAFATGPDKVAKDGDGEHSPFTEAVLKYIEEPDVSISDFLINVRNDVYDRTNGEQEPWDQSSLRSRFVFRSKDKGYFPEAGRPSPNSSEVARSIPTSTEAATPALAFSEAAKPVLASSKIATPSTEADAPVAPSPEAAALVPTKIESSGVQSREGAGQRLTGRWVATLLVICSATLLVFFALRGTFSINDTKATARGSGTSVEDSSAETSGKNPLNSTEKSVINTPNSTEKTQSNAGNQALPDPPPKEQSRQSTPIIITPNLFESMTASHWCTPNRTYSLQIAGKSVVWTDNSGSSDKEGIVSNSVNEAQTVTQKSSHTASASEAVGTVWTYSLLGPNKVLVKSNSGKSFSLTRC